MIKPDGVVSSQNPFFLKWGIPFNTFTLLDHLYAHKGNTAGAEETADALLITRRTMAAIVDRLERQGVVERVQHPKDPRRSIIRLTEKGDKRIRLLQKKPQEARMAAMAAMGKADRRTPSRILVKPDGCPESSPPVRMSHP